MATQLKNNLFGVAAPSGPAADLQQLHRMLLSEMARLQDEMERLEMPNEAIEKYRDAMLIAVEDHRRRFTADEPLVRLAAPADGKLSALDLPPPMRSLAMRRFLGF